MHVSIDRRTFLTTAAAVAAGSPLLAQDEPKFVESAQVGGSKSPTDLNRPKIEPLDNKNRVDVKFSETQRFGIICPKLRDPRSPEKPKLLTRDERGITNNTAIRIEGYEYLYGTEIPGTRYVKEKGVLMKEVPIPGKDKDRTWQSVWESEFARIRITQSVELIIGEQTRLYDTALVKYHIWCRDKTPHNVGLRIMLDTFIGSNDGLPFYVSPTASKSAHFVDKMEVIAQKDMPSFIQSLESTDLADPNSALARVGVKLKGCEPVEKLVICRWPQNSEARWGGTGAPGDWAYEPMDKNPNARDSCVVLYWATTNMKPDEMRALAFTYGLGRVLSDANNEAAAAQGGKLRLFTSPGARTGQPFVVCAYVKGDAKVTLKLPVGLTLADGDKAEQAASAANNAGYGQVSWRVQGAKAGKFAISAEAPGIGIAKETVEVRDTSLFE
jgi:hypothetical protein